MIPRRRRPPPPGIPGPEALEAHPRHLVLEGGLARTYHVSGYPREVGPGWLGPLLGHRDLLDVAFHVEPVANDEAARLLERQRARMASDVRRAEDAGELADEEAVASGEDAAELAAAIARGEQRLFRHSLYFTVRAPTEEALAVRAHRAETLARSLLLRVHPATFRPLRAWYSTLPLGLDLLRRRRILPTRPLAFAFPFATGDVEDHGTGALYGVNLATVAPVVLDRFRLHNHNQVIVGQSGAGKSFAAKLGVLQSLERGVEVAVVDPEDEFVRLAEAVGGTVVRMGASGVGVNPFELSSSGPGALEQQRFFLRSLLGVLLGDLSPDDAEALDAAVGEAYRSAGITEDARTHGHAAPELEDFCRALVARGAGHIARRLGPWVSGTYRDLLSGPTTVRPEGHLVVFALRHLPEEPAELRTAAMLAATDLIWRRVSAGDRPREVVVDEAWQFMGMAPVARFFQSLAKRGRKRWCGLTFVTQDLQDISSGPGRAVLTNSAVRMLFRTSPESIGEVAWAFGLTRGECAFLTAAPRGQGLLVFPSPGGATGSQRARIKVVASEEERSLLTTEPAEVRRLEAVR